MQVFLCQREPIRYFRSSDNMWTKGSVVKLWKSATQTKKGRRVAGVGTPSSLTPIAELAARSASVPACGLPLRRESKGQPGLRHHQSEAERSSSKLGFRSPYSDRLDDQGEKRRAAQKGSAAHHCQQRGVIEHVSTPLVCTCASRSVFAYYRATMKYGENRCSIAAL